LSGKEFHKDGAATANAQFVRCRLLCSRNHEVSRCGLSKRTITAGNT